MIARIFIVLFFILCFWPSDLLFAQEMRCELYTISEHNLKQERSVCDLLQIHSGKFLLIEPVDMNKYHPPLGQWTIVWRSADGLRIVAMIVVDFDQSSFESPVHVIDIDYSRSRFRWNSMGGYIDLYEMILSPWEQECHRLD